MQQFQCTCSQEALEQGDRHYPLVIELVAMENRNFYWVNQRLEDPVILGPIDLKLADVETCLSKQGTFFFGGLW